MCVSNNAIEQQACRFAERMIKNSLYQPISVVVLGNKSIPVQNGNPLQLHGMPLVTSVVFKDDYGTIYEIAPDENGSRFATGEISYTEYLVLQKKGNRKLFGILLGSSAGLLLMGWGLVSLFLQ